MMSIAHRQLAEMEAERQAMEAAKKETITEDGTIIEISKGDFVPKPRVAAEAPKPVERDMSPRPFSEDIQFFHHNGSMVVDNGQVGFLSEVRKKWCDILTAYAQAGAGEESHALCLPVGNLSATLSL